MFRSQQGKVFFKEHPHNYITLLMDNIAVKQKSILLKALFCQPLIYQYTKCDVAFP